MFDPEAPPEFKVTRWLNTVDPPALASLKGRVVVLLAFQMLCPGCVAHALPQLRRLAGLFNDDEVMVIALHTVFEHHAAMTPLALEAFAHEYGLEFPIGIDSPDGTGMPKTMAAYQMRGTPTLLLFDRQGRLRRHYMGQVDDMRLAAEVMAMSIEERDAPREEAVAIERKLHATLVDPNAHHHDHDHDHGHQHDDAHAGHQHHHGDACVHHHGDDHAKLNDHPDTEGQGHPHPPRDGGRRA